MRANKQGRQIIKDSEGLQLVAYPDPASPLFKACQRAHVSPYNDGYAAIDGWERTNGHPWTIGFGHTGADVHPGDAIDKDKAEDLLSSDLLHTESGVQALLLVPVNGNQFSALVSLAYNIGLGNLATSTVIRRLDEGDVAGAAEAFKLWNKARGEVLPGLVARREREAALFLTPGDGDAA